MRGETCSGLMRMLPLAFQSTPLVRGETALPKVPKGGESFQSTPLMRGETRPCRVHVPHPLISIHSPHARGDQLSASEATPASYFNPLPSCEGRPVQSDKLIVIVRFQSTPLMRGETRHIDKRGDGDVISIHSPHARGDFTHWLGQEMIPISIHSPHTRGDPTTLQNLVDRV